jgi:hypothetical protein
MARVPYLIPSQNTINEARTPPLHRLAASYGGLPSVHLPFCPDI